MYYVSACMLHAASKLLKHFLEKTFGESGLGKETFQKFLHTFWSDQEDISDIFEAEWNSANPGVPDGRVLYLDS